MMPLGDRRTVFSELIVIFAAVNLLRVVVANQFTVIDVDVLNITRLRQGDAFYITGGECGVTRCTEVSRGTALSLLPPGAGPPCSCQCPTNLPLFREDLMQCVEDVTECPLAEFGSGSSASKIPFVFIPLSGQIVNPTNDIKFEDSENAVCVVSGAQYLTKTGWSTLKNDVDGDVPFALYRDENRTFLQWRGSEITRSRATGRLILTKLTCRVASKMIAPCVAFRVSGSPPGLNHDMTEVWFSRGEVSAEKHEDNNKSNVMGGAVGVAIVFCTFMALLIYGAILVYHFRTKNKPRVVTDVENPPFKDDTMPNTKMNPLVNMDAFIKNNQSGSFNGSKSDSISTASSSSSKQSSIDSLEIKETGRKCNHRHRHKRMIKNDSVMVTNATIHSNKNRNNDIRRVSSPTFFTQCGSVEKIPETHIAIVEAPETSEAFVLKTEMVERDSNNSIIGTQRKKLYFNPSFFELHYLKTPPPAAVEFLTKIREVISLAKDKMLSKRFVPILTPIPEEEIFHCMDFSFHCDSLRRLRVAASLKRENSRRKNSCSGCPGCADSKLKTHVKTSASEKEFCKSCVTSDSKHEIVRKWLEEVPLSSDGNVDTLKQYRKSIAKVEGTPAPIKPKPIKTEAVNNQSSRKSMIDEDAPPPLPIKSKLANSIPDIINNSDKITIKVQSENTKMRRKKMPPPPPPPPPPPLPETTQNTTREEKKKTDDDRIPIPPELKQKMNAVIDELSKFRKIEPIQPRVPSPVSEVVTPFIPNTIIAVTPRLVIPTPPRYAKKLKPKIISFREDQNYVNDEYVYEIDSLERITPKRRASLSNLDHNWYENSLTKRRSSIVAMEELEPMKKIYEMNSRLSRSFQELSATSTIWNDGLLSLQDVDNYSQKNLVSEVYVNDYDNVAQSDHSSTSVKIKYKEPVTRPGQLIIEVDGPTRNTNQINHDYEDFDPDTLDRKPGKLKLYPKEISLSPPISPSKIIDDMFYKEGSSNSSIRDSDNENKIEAPIMRVGSLLEIFEAKNKINSLEKVNRSKPPDVTIIDVQDSSDDYKPPLPPKKKYSKTVEDTAWENQSTYRVTDKVRKSPEKDWMRFKITRSEPNTNRNSSYNKYLTNELNNKEKKKYTLFGGSVEDKINNGSMNDFHSLDSSNYTNYYDEDRNNNNKYCKSVDDDAYEKISVKDMPVVRKQGRRSTRQRYKRMEQKKNSKTEDSGYLSSDSNESRYKGKFVLQVRDKDDVLKEVISDTDDLDSAEDARSESGGESIETNSVFFGSFRRLSRANDLRNSELNHKSTDSGFQENSYRKNKNVSAYIERFSSMGNT